MYDCNISHRLKYTTDKCLQTQVPERPIYATSHLRLALQPQLECYRILNAKERALLLDQV